MSSVINDQGVNYVTLADKEFQILMVKGYCTRAEPNSVTNPKYHTMTFAPVQFLETMYKPINNFYTEVKEPLKKLFLKSVLALTTNDALKKSYKDNDITVQFPDDNKNNMISCWAWKNIIKDPNHALMNMCQFIIRIKQVTVIFEKQKDNKIKYTILPKFEIFSSIKIVNNILTKMEHVDIQEDILVEDFENMETQSVDLIPLLKRTHSSDDNNEEDDKDEQDKKANKKKSKKN